jgi:acetyl-CoA C-acetyltransferase
MSPQQEVYIIDGARTPFLKVRSKQGPFSASDLAVNAGRELLARQPFLPQDIGEVILGCVMPSSNEANIARVVALRLGCGKGVPAWTVQRNCASGMQALDSGFKDILLGRHDLVLAGGTEAMSRAPVLFSDKMVNWLGGLASSKNTLAKLKQMAYFRLNFLSPVFALLNGLTDPVVNLSMGQTAENLAYKFNITRKEMDEFAMQSHQRVADAEDNGYLKEVIAAYDTLGNVYTEDDGIRRDSTLEKLAQLKHFFDKKFGNVTAGNSSQVTDGAAVLLLASKKAVQEYNLPVLARIVGVEWAGLDPAEMGLGPVYAATALMRRLQLTKDKIDFWEINEAFSAQVLACLAAWENEDFCREQLGLDHAFGKINADQLNIDGGAIALGHPVGASGARIVLHLADILKRKKARLGMAAICIGGGLGGAMLIENTSEVSV